jgi:hypothetical protein
MRWKKRVLADVEGYEDWWNSVHLLVGDAEDYLDGRSKLSCTSLLDRALHTVARGLWLLQRGLVKDWDHWRHLMIRAMQAYLTVRSGKWRFTIHDPTREEAEEIMRLAEEALNKHQPPSDE